MQEIWSFNIFCCQEEELNWSSIVVQKFSHLLTVTVLSKFELNKQAVPAEVWTFMLKSLHFVIVLCGEQLCFVQTFSRLLVVTLI
jgi:hypothetical protein